VRLFDSLLPEEIPQTGYRLPVRHEAWYIVDVTSSGGPGHTSPVGLYFSSSDGGIEHSITQVEFDRSLVYNLLFEPTGLVVPDVFFFNCPFLIDHIESTGRSLFESALSRGLVIPAFRAVETTSFRESLEELGIQAVLGIEDSQYRTTPERLARRLDRVYLASREEPRKIVWPADMGGAFGRLVTAVLQQGDLPSANEYLRQLWKDTESWRIECLPRAERLTALTGGTGIRRGEIWNAVGQLLGTLDQDGKFDKPRDLVASVPEKSYLKAQVEHFVNVVNICYQRNQALRFGAIHNIPSSLSRDAAPVVPGFDIFTSVNPAHSFAMEVMLPAASTLLRADTRELMAVRESDPGAGYFERRWAWAGHPSTDTEEELREAIRQYANALTEMARGPQKKTLLGFASQRGRNVIDSAVGAAVTLGTSRLGIPAEFSIVSGIGSAFASDMIVSTLQVLRDGPYIPKERFVVEAESAPEVNLPA
jgi:hypothetical protein